MSFKSALYFTSVICTAAFLASCGGGGGSSSSGSGGSTGGGGSTADVTAPAVAFNPTTLNVVSGGSASAALTATDAGGITSGPSVTCTNGGSFNVATNTFTAASVTANTTSTCTATAGDAAGNSGTGTLTVTMTPASAITLTGRVHKGLVSGATIRITDAAGGSAAPTLVSGTTAADGSYSLTIPQGTSVGNLLVVETFLAGAQMICDAANCASQGGIPFGTNLLVPANNTAPGAAPRTLSAAVPTPALGTTTVNVNMFTHYQILDMIGKAVDTQATAGGIIAIALSDYAPTRQSTATLFGLPDADFFAIPFVDVTTSITSTSQDAVYAALLGGGLMGAALEAPAPFDAIEQFQARAINDDVFANETSDVSSIISIEDIFENAVDLAAQIGASGNTFTGAQNALIAREAAVDAAGLDRFVNDDGTLAPDVPDITFRADTSTIPQSLTNVGIPIHNSSNLAYTAAVNAGTGSGFFSVASTGTLPNGQPFVSFSLNNGLGNIPVGMYSIGVTFTTSGSVQYVDMITFNIVP